MRRGHTCNYIPLIFIHLLAKILKNVFILFFLTFIVSSLSYIWCSRYIVKRSRNSCPVVMLLISTDNLVTGEKRLLTVLSFSLTFIFFFTPF